MLGLVGRQSGAVSVWVWSSWGSLRAVRRRRRDPAARLPAGPVRERFHSRKPALRRTRRALRTTGRTSSSSAAASSRERLQPGEEGSALRAHGRGRRVPLGSRRTKRWIPLTDHFERMTNYLGIESIAPDPVDPNKVYAAVGTYTQSWAGNGAIVRSNDQGNTWEVHRDDDQDGRQRERPLERRAPRRRSEPDRKSSSSARGETGSGRARTRPSRGRRSSPSPSRRTKRASASRSSSSTRRAARRASRHPSSTRASRAQATRRLYRSTDAGRDVESASQAAADVHAAAPRARLEGHRLHRVLQRARAARHGGRGSGRRRLQVRPEIRSLYGHHAGQVEPRARRQVRLRRALPSTRRTPGRSSSRPSIATRRATTSFARPTAERPGRTCSPRPSGTSRARSTSTGTGPSSTNRTGSATSTSTRTIPLT